jgi:hypothetical protein
MAAIPGLPEHLVEVPPAPSHPDAPDADAKRAAFRAWRDDVLRYRIEYQDACYADPQMQVIDRELCGRSCAYFVTMWGNLFEPRTGDPHRISGTFAWIPFARQVEFWNWLDERLISAGASADGISSKARDMGASWSCCAWAAHKWLFAETFTALLVSKKEDLVDSNTSESLFWKIEHFLGYKTGAVPSWLLPAGFAWQDKQMNQQGALVNPENGNEILGESTNSEAGRAARATVMIFDEAAFIPKFGGVWAGATNTTAHKIAVSTESLKEGPTFYNLVRWVDMEVGPDRFIWEWYENPQNDDVWYEAMRDRFANEPGKFEQEVLRNPMGGDETYVYPAAMDKETDPLIHYVEGFPLAITMDPGFNDRTAILWLQEQDSGWVVLDSYERRNQPAAFYGCIITGYSHFIEAEQVSYPFPFSERDEEIMQWTRTLPRVNIVGDSYGDNSSGATGDSVYDVLRRPPFRLKINTDRTPQGDVSAHQKVVRQFKGRREALRRLLPYIRFADTMGARTVLRALQQNKFDEDSGNSVTEASRPLHDWTSHYVSALEFWAATLESRRMIKQTKQGQLERQAARNAKHYSGKHTNPYSRSLGPSPYQKRKVA